MAYLRNTNT